MSAVNIYYIYDPLYTIVHWSPFKMLPIAPVMEVQSCRSALERPLWCEKGGFLVSWFYVRCILKCKSIFCPVKCCQFWEKSILEIFWNQIHGISDPESLTFAWAQQENLTAKAALNNKDTACYRGFTFVPHSVAFLPGLSCGIPHQISISSLLRVAFSVYQISINQFLVSGESRKLWWG